MKNSKIFDYRVLAFTTVIIILQLLFINDERFYFFLSFIEFFCLISILLIKGIRHFLLILLVFSSSSFEIADFIGYNVTIYSITNLPIFGNYPFIVISFIIFYATINKYGRGIISNEQPNLTFLSKFALYTIISGLLMGIICLISNDNNILLGNYTVFYKKDFIRYFIIAGYLISFILVIKKDIVFHQQIKKYLFSILCSLIIVALFSILGDFKGSYGGKDIILMPLAFFFSTSIILFIFDINYIKVRRQIIILSVIAIYLQLFYANAMSGKSWLAIISIITIIGIRSLRNGSKLLIILLIIFLAGFGSYYISNLKTDKEDLKAIKFDQAISLLLINRDNYYLNLPASPKARIEEFHNTIIEFNKKPFYGIFGKGYGGSIRDHSRSFGNYLSYFFSDDEYENNTFVFLHESINIILLKFGLVGLILVFIILIRYFKLINKSPFITIGIFWLIFFFGYTFSLGFFGIASLVLGFYEGDYSTK